VDGVWDFALVRYGWMGLGLLAWVWAAPCVILICRLPRGAARDSRLVLVAGLAVILVLHGWDSLMNSSLSPIWIACLGGMGTPGARVERAGASVDDQVVPVKSRR
jgi:hypothetical protein